MSTDWFARWALLALLSLVDAVWLWSKGIGFAFEPLDGRLRLALLFLFWCLVSHLVLSRARSFARVLRASSDYFYSMAQLFMAMVPAATIIYLAATLDAPVVDGSLQRADALMGFD